MKFFSLILIPMLLWAGEYILVFEGNRFFSDDRLYQELGFERSFWDKLRGKREVKIDKKLIDPLKEQLLLFYKEEGFWDTQIKTVTKKTRVIFSIRESRPIKIASVEITSDFPIKNLINLKNGDRFNAKEFALSKERIKKALLKAGYCSFDLDAKAYLFVKRKTAYLVYYLQKGSPCKIKSVTLSGNTTLKEEVIKDHIFLKPNEPFYLEKVEESYRSLYSLEYFESVYIDYSKKIDNQIFVNVKTKEKDKNNIYRISAGFETLHGPKASISYKNLNISSKQLYFELKSSKNLKLSKISLFVPSLSIFDRRFDTIFTASYSDEKYEIFREKKGSFSVSIAKEYYKRSIKLSMGTEQIDISSEELCIKTGRFNLIYPTVEFAIDARDSKLSPKNGYYLKNKTKFALFDQKNRFVKNATKAKFLKTFNKIGLSFKADISFLAELSGDPPVSWLLYAGGANSNRAYSYNRLTATDTACKIGGKILLDTSLEADFPLYEKIKGALFWDRTAIKNRSYDILSKAVNSAGIGLRYDTVIGELRADFGFRMDEFSQNAFHIYLGGVF